MMPKHRNPLVDPILVASREAASDQPARVALQNIQSILYRKPTHYQMDAHLPPQVQVFAENEASFGFGGLLRSLDCFWISQIDAIRAASFKPRQLSLARKLGLQTPKTLITNDPEAVQSFYHACHHRMICKPFYAGNIGVTHEEWDVIYTSLVTPEDMGYAGQVQYTAHQFQEFLQKQYELRVTVVGHQAFTARIDAPRGNIDFRTDYPSLTYTPYQLPATLEHACIRLVHDLGLMYGAIDILRDREGAYFFLEVNPAGQYHWIEYHTRLPITEAIVHLLITGGNYG